MDRTAIPRSACCSIASSLVRAAAGWRSAGVSGYERLLLVEAAGATAGNGVGDGHYLCTVAALGHRFLVKPLRPGIRHGMSITVNRQLMIANAFENVLEQYMPACHRTIRRLYDKYGYPVSRQIRTKTAADVIYVAMKPLEWFFLLVLYTVDIRPEDRIQVQYSGFGKKISRPDAELTG